MLHTEVRGTGPDLVMVHGWGMHAGVWEDWADSLTGRFRVHLIDLPGHGYSKFTAGEHLDDWSAALAEVAPAEAWWLGWSLGGLLTLNLARLDPDRVRGLIQLASTPRFVASTDWPYGVEAAVFDQFAGQLADDARRTLARFLALQVRGANHGNDTLRRLRSRLEQRPQPQAEALKAGLRLLQDTDLRIELATLNVPTRWLLGARDTLVPSNLGEQVPGRYVVVDGAGHAPFLSHPETCTAAITDWLRPTDGVNRHATG